MGKYLSAEWYKALHRKYIYIFSAVILGLAVVFMLLMRVEGRHFTEEGLIQKVSVTVLIGVLCQALSFGLYFLLIAADVVFSDQYKYNTLKNEVSYGLPRERIYLGKLMATALLSILLCVVLIGGYLVFACVLFPLGETFNGAMETLGRYILVALPLWLGGLGLYNMLQFMIKGSNMPAVAYVMIIGVFGGGFLELMGMFIPSLAPVSKLIKTISLQTPFTLIRTQSAESLMGYAWVLGMTWLVGSTVVGLVSFRKREIS